MAQPRASSGLLRGFDIDEASDKPVAEQLRDALSRHAVRVIDLFREWDDEHNRIAGVKAPVCPLAGLPYACQHIRGSAVHRCKPDSAAAGHALSTPAEREQWAATLRVGVSLEHQSLSMSAAPDALRNRQRA